MKKLIFILLFNIIVLKLSFAQLCGTYTIPGNYPSISSAIAALNSSGISCPVIFLVSAGYKETAANLTINPITGSTFYNRVSFQKSGSGANPKIRAGIGTGSYDGIIKFNGASNVTFDGIDVSDTVTNTNTTTAMEWGYALLRPDAIHGCQYDTIRNCKITLNASVSIATSWGIYAKNMTLTGGGITPTALSGTTSYNAFVSNYITNTYGGIYLYGYADPNYPYDLYDHNNIITSGASAQSTITNFGTSLTISNYTYGVYTYYQNGLQILNTNINNTADGGVPAGAYAYGIYAGSGSNASTAISGNTITLSSSYCCDYICGIYNLSGNTGVDNYINISNNSVINCRDSLGTSYTFYGIYSNSEPYNLSVSGNYISGNTMGGPAATCTGSFYGIYLNGYNTYNGVLWTINNNNISNNKRYQLTLAAGTEYMIYAYYSGATTNIQGNIISNDSLPSSGAFYGVYIYSPYCTSLNCNNNSIKNIFFPLSSTKSFVGIYNGNIGCTSTTNYNSNNICNITSTGSSAMYPINVNNGCTDVICNISGDSIYNINSTGGNIYGIYNTISNITNIKSNNIYGLYTTSGRIYGMYLSSGTNAYVYNNFISDLRATSGSSSGLSPSISGIYANGVTNADLYNNTIFLNASSSASSFATAGIWASTTNTTDMRNNIVINNSNPGSSGGYACAYMRNTSNLSTYAATSNNNCFYAGIPAANRLIYYDGTNSVQTIAAYKTLMAPREANSLTENPPFSNVSTVPYNLHLITCDSSYCESGASIITTPISITTDIDGQSRYPNSGFPICTTIQPAAPDIGADEFGGIPKFVSVTQNQSRIPTEYKLYVNYPNPFNPITKIKFDIAASPVPSKGGGQEVSLKIYDILGREVATLVNEKLSPGTYEVEWDGRNYPSGVYLYKLTSGEYTETKKLILLK